MFNVHHSFIVWLQDNLPELRVQDANVKLESRKYPGLFLSCRQIKRVNNILWEHDYVLTVYNNQPGDEINLRRWLFQVLDLCQFLTSGEANFDCIKLFDISTGDKLPSAELVQAGGIKIKLPNLLVSSVEDPERPEIGAYSFDIILQSYLV